MWFHEDAELLEKNFYESYIYIFSFKMNLNLPLLFFWQIWGIVLS